VLEISVCGKSLSDGTSYGEFLTDGTSYGEFLSDGTSYGEFLSDGTSYGEFPTDGTSYGDFLTDGASYKVQNLDEFFEDIEQINNLVILLGMEEETLKCRDRSCAV